MSNVTYPNDQFIVDLTGSKRDDYLSNVSGIYNTLKNEGYMVPSTTIKGSGDSNYIEFELINGDNINNLLSSSNITPEKAKDVRKRALEHARKIQKEKEMTIYNIHGGNIFYNPDTDNVYLYDVIQNSMNKEANKVTKFSQEYLDSMKNDADEEETV